jgi:peptide/nickel transport system permease protein
MWRYILLRLLESLFAIWGVISLVFVITRLLGDPVVLLLPVGASEQELTAMRHSLGLDLPLTTQYFHTLWAMLQGDFGISFQYLQPAMDIVLQRLPATVELASVSLLGGVILGAMAGAVAALMRGSLVELLVMVLALIGQATPVFWLGIMLIMFFAVDLGWLPTGGYGSVLSLVLPGLTLAVYVAASIARLVRSSLLEILREDYVRTARAKGLLPHTLFFWHVARNALIPVITMTGIIAGELLGGSVVTETVFAWPGVGRLIVQAIQVHDFPVIQAGVVTIAVIFVAINLLVDVLYGVLDPRIRRRR